MFMNSYAPKACMAILLGTFAVCCGCGGPAGPTVVPVSGTVEYKGQPLANGIVTFSPADPKTGRPAQADIKPNGTFQLSTFVPGDGILAGDYAVSITSSIKGTEPLERDKGTGIGGKSAIPEKYNDPKTSGLKETIEPGEPRNDVLLDLKDE